MNGRHNPWQIREALLGWYDANHRVLPWRRNEHSKRRAADPSYACPPAALPLNDFMYFVFVCEVIFLCATMHLPAPAPAASSRRRPHSGQLACMMRWAMQPPVSCSHQLCEHVACKRCLQGRRQKMTVAAVGLKQ